jgi:hypothetical protein
MSCECNEVEWARETMIRYCPDHYGPCEFCVDCGKHTEEEEGTTTAHRRRRRDDDRMSDTKRKKQVFELEGNVRVTIEFPPDAVRWSSTHNTVQIASGDAALPQAIAPTVQQPRNPAFSLVPSGDSVDSLTEINPKAIPYTGEGPPPPGFDPLAMLNSFTDQVERNLIAQELG